MCRDAAAHTVIHHEQDIRTGGRWRIEVRDASKKEVYWGQGVYRQVKPPEKLVFSWFWTKDTPDGVNLHPGSEETEVTVEFLERGDSTEVVLTHAVFGSAKIRDDHDGGWNCCFDLLERVLGVSGKQ